MTPGAVLAAFALILFSFLGIIFMLDIHWYTDDVERNSITQATIDYSKKYPIIAWVWGFAMGALVGHFWL